MGVLNSPRPEVAVTRAAPEPLGPRREDKFLATADQAVAFADWAAGRFEPDPHTGPDGSYLVVSLYFDTAAFDSFRRGGDGGWPKHRLRSYGSDPELRFLEEKLRRGDRVWKRRVRCAPGDWPDGAPAGDEPGQLWFRRRWQRLGLRPVLHVTYRRVAFVSADGDRVTIDSDLACCAAAPQGAVSLAAPGPTRAVATPHVIELKYAGVPSAPMAAAIARLGQRPVRTSKYSIGVRELGLDPADGSST